MKRYVILLLILGLFTFGCVDMIKTPCNKTTDCSGNQICKDGYCYTLPPCRNENETCDVTSDCCDEFICEENICVKKTCPATCDDDNNCTKDYCDYSTIFTCQHEEIIPCCGNDVCETTENCATCLLDCECKKNETCVDDECVSAYDYEAEQIGDKYNLSTCYDEIFAAWDYERYSEVRDKIESCREQIVSYKNDIYNLGSRLELTENQSNNSQASIYALMSVDRFWLYWYETTEIVEKIESGETYDDYDYLLDQKSALFELEASLYYLYLIKTEYPVQWDEDEEDLEDVFDNIAMLYESVNQQINSVYDSFGSWDYKYAFQVDPLDPFIIDVTDDLTEGMVDEEEIKLELLHYVQDNVNYSHDPNWQTDWVQPPVFTLMTGYGDCDDHAVLLASMFHRAGIPNVEMCFVDTNYDEIPDHLAVATRNGYALDVYDATWKDERDPIRESEYPGWIYCFDVEAVQQYAMAPKCSDGTIYGYCSESAPYYCDDGILVQDCEYCGCSYSKPYCVSEGFRRGECFSCFGNAYTDGTCCSYGYYWVDYGLCCPDGTYYYDGSCYYS